MKIVAFYTRDTPYAVDARLLRASLERAGLDHSIVAVPDAGSWHTNTARKATFLLAQRRFHTGPLLYVDVDAFVHADPWPHVDLSADFGAHFFAGPARGWVRTNVCPCVRGGECDREHRLMSGTLYLGDTTGCRALLADWVSLNQARSAAGDPRGGGQRNLWLAWDAMRDRLETARLPGRLCYVFDKPWAYPKGEPIIIEHTIASRENRPTDAMDRGFWRRSHRPRQERVEQLRRLVS